MSGYLKGEEHLVNKAAAVDVPMVSGRVILLGFGVKEPNPTAPSSSSSIPCITSISRFPLPQRGRAQGEGEQIDPPLSVHCLLCFCPAQPGLRLDGCGKPPAVLVAYLVAERDRTF
jgi:hypothetical protein